MTTHQPDRSTDRGSLPLAALLMALGAGTMLAAILGPLLAGVIDYRTSATTLNQVVGGDLAALVVVAPVALVAGVLVLVSHRAGPVLWRWPPRRGPSTCTRS